MYRRRIGRGVLIFSVILIIFSLALSAWLNIRSFKQYFTNSLLTSAAVAGNEGCSKIEYAIKYGKPLDNFYGIQDILQEIKKDTPDVKDIRILTPGGRILYTLYAKDENRGLQAALLMGMEFHRPSAQQSLKTAHLNGEYNVLLPVYDRYGAVAGVMNLIFSEKTLNQQVMVYLKRAIFYMGVLAMLAIGGLLFFLSRMQLFSENCHFRKHVFVISLIAIMGAVQFAFGLINVMLFRDAYTRVAKEQITHTAAKIIRKDIDGLIQKGLTYANLPGIEKWMENIISYIPELQSVSVNSGDGKNLYAAYQKQFYHGRMENSVCGYRFSLEKDQTGKNAYLYVRVGQKYIDAKVREIALDALTVFAVSLFVLLFLTIFFVLFMQRQVVKVETEEIKFVFAAAAVCLIIMVLGFNGGLSISSFKKNYLNSLVSEYTVAGGEVRKKIEYAVKYGKPLDNFYGIQEILEEVKTDTPDLEDVRVIWPNGRIIYSLSGVKNNQHFSKELAAQVNFGNSNTAKPYISILYEDKYHAFLPIQARDGKWIGSLDLVFDGEIVNAHIDQYQRKTMHYLVIIAAIAAGVIAFFLFTAPIISQGRIRKKFLMLLLLLVLGIAQIVYGLLNIRMFREAYTEIARDNSISVARIIKNDINVLLAKGVACDDFYGLEKWLGRILQTVPEIGRIVIKEESGKTLYSAQKGDLHRQDALQAQEFRLDKDIYGRGSIARIYLSKRFIDGRVLEIALDTATVLVTSFFFMIELIIFLLLFIGHYWGRKQEVEEDTVANEFQLVRPLAFILLIGSYMSVSFIPILMKDLYRPLLGLSKDVIIALPVTMEMLGATITTILTGYIIDHKGWRPPFFAGAAILTCGSLLSGFAGSEGAFILARTVAGAGYGFTWMALRGYVATSTNEKAKSDGFSALNAGIFAGMNCGVVLGAMLAERIGYRTVFLISMGVVILSGLFALSFIRNKKILHLAPKGDLPAANSLWGFLKDRRVFGLLFFITVPAGICGMFNNYFFPLYAKGLGVSQSNIGRSILIYGMCIIYLGPFLSKQVKKYMDAGKAVAFSALISVSALLVFALKGSFWLAVLTIFLIGVSDCFGFVVQNTYFVGLPLTREFGQGKALGIFSTARKVGQMLGPMAFGAVASLGAGKGVGVIGIIFLAALIFFSVMSFPRQKKIHFRKIGA